MKNYIKVKIRTRTGPEIPQTTNGLIQMIRIKVFKESVNIFPLEGIGKGVVQIYDKSSC